MYLTSVVMDVRAFYTSVFSVKSSDAIHACVCACVLPVMDEAERSTVFMFKIITVLSVNLLTPFHPSASAHRCFICSSPFSML